MMIEVFFFAVIVVSTAQASQLFRFDVNTTRLYTRTSAYFASVTIDVGNVGKRWSRLSDVFASERAINAAKGLSPAILRLGGTAEDAIFFNSSTESRMPNFPNETYAMTASQWDAINDFAERVKWNLTFGLNSLRRNPDGSWNSANALQLLKYTTDKKYNVSWELGNEPDVKQHQVNITVQPEQLARDFETLRAMIDSLGLSPSSQIRLAGPDTTSIGKKEAATYFYRFLESLSNGVIDAATWHHYYIHGGTAEKAFDFHDVRLFDSLIPAAKLARSYANQLAPNAELWLGETGLATKGGQENLTDAYASGLLWLDKLGLAAATNHSVVCRQQFFAGDEVNHISLLDVNLNPNPDYFTTLLYRRLVGRGVLEVTGSTAMNRSVRLYGHCASKLYRKGAVVFFVVNIEKRTVQIELQSNVGRGPVDMYLLTPTSGSIESRKIDLNGKTLQLVNETLLPELVPRILDPSEPIIFPPLTYGFFVFSQANAEACLED